MTGRNLAKPFAIAGFILAEIYMLFTVLAPYGHESHALPMPIPEVAMASSVPPGTPPPLKTKITTVLVLSVFFGPFGALVGMGVGLMASGLRGDFKQWDKGNPERPENPPV